jgi:pimeloyl-ACP methyl ester carboxylesterase
MDEIWSGTLKAIAATAQVSAMPGAGAIPHSLFVIAGYNGLKPVRDWVGQLERHGTAASGYSWRDAASAGRDIRALSPQTCVTLIGHSLGGGQAELLAQSLPAGTIDILITVAAFGPSDIDHDLTRRRVGRWLNIVSAPPKRDWQDFARKLAAPLLLNWHEQGWIDSASENHLSPHPHQDFYKLMNERCGAVEHGHYRPFTPG